MEVMSNHEFHDEDIDRILWEGHEDNREIVLNEKCEGAIIINKRDIVAFAKEFNLVVYEKGANL